MADTRLIPEKRLGRSSMKSSSYNFSCTGLTGILHAALKAMAMAAVDNIRRFSAGEKGIDERTLYTEKPNRLGCRLQDQIAGAGSHHL
jgi:hypothetical protein